MIDVPSFVAKCCMSGRSAVWDIASRYCEVAGLPLHESHIRSVIPQFAEWSGTDRKFVFLQPADQTEVVYKFLEATKPVAGEWVSIDTLVKQIIAWSPLRLDHMLIRLLLEKQLRPDGRVPART